MNRDNKFVNEIERKKVSQLPNKVRVQNKWDKLMKYKTTRLV